jgi:hypothetical protein
MLMAQRNFIFAVATHAFGAKIGNSGLRDVTLWWLEYPVRPTPRSDTAALVIRDIPRLVTSRACFRLRARLLLALISQGCHVLYIVEDANCLN